MQEIQQMLVNNAGNRLTMELINGMAHEIKQQFDMLQTQLIEARAEIDLLSSKEES